MNIKMLLELAFKSLFRHKKKSIELTVFLVLATVFFIVFYNFITTFNVEYTKAGIELVSSDIQILRKDHNIFFKDQIIEKKVLDKNIFDYTSELRTELASIDGIAAFEPVLELDSILYYMDGSWDSWNLLRGVSVSKNDLVLPYADVTNLVNSHTFDVPVLRYQPHKDQNEPIYYASMNNLHFDNENLQYQWNFVADVFEHLPSKVKNIQEAITILNELIDNEKLYTLVPENIVSSSIEIEDCVYYAEYLETENTTNKRKILQNNRELLHLLFPYLIYPASSYPYLNESMTISIEALGSHAQNAPVIIPVSYVGYAEYLPMFGYYYSYISLPVLQEYLNVDDSKINSIHIRITSTASIDKVKSEIQGFLDCNYPELAIADYSLLGQQHLIINFVVYIIAFIIFGLLAVVIVIHIINATYTEVITRQKEIATYILLGLEQNHAVHIFVLEKAIVGFLAFCFANIISVVLINWIFHNRFIDLPFFPNDITPLFYYLDSLLVSFIFVFCSSILFSRLACNKIRNADLPELITEAQ